MSVVSAMLQGDCADDMKYVSTDRSAITTKSGRIEPDDIVKAAQYIRDYHDAIEEMRVITSNLKMTEHSHFLSD